MKKNQVKRRIDIALEMLRVNDNYLLENDLNERSITHKIAMYLSQTFGNNYDVDCEYNRNIKDESSHKMIYLLETELSKIVRTYSLASDDEQDNSVMIEKSVYPDIIVHKRGSDSKNLLAIEVKKSTSNVSEQFDLLKLCKYTENNFDQGLCYQYGIFIKVFTKSKKYVQPELLLFQKGEVTKW